MKRAITLTMTLIFVFSCKNKNTAYSKPIKGVEEQSIILPNHSLWVLNRLSLTKVKEGLNQTNKQLFILSRTSTTKTAYASVNNIPVEMGNYYRTSVLVKKDGLGVSFGLRMIGEYPNRVDAVFDLEKGLIKGVSDVGTFIKGAAKIEDMGEGWYKCSLIAEVYSNKMKIILGPTSGFGKTITWEGTTKEKSSVYITPSSLVLEELSN